MTPPHMPSFCTIQGLWVAEIFRDICKTMRETSRMPEIIFVSVHLQHSAGVCSYESMLPLHSHHNTPYQTTPGILALAPSRIRGMNTARAISSYSSCSVWGRTLQGSSSVSPAMLLLPRSAQGERRCETRWTMTQSSRHQARPKAGWLTAAQP